MCSVSTAFQIPYQRKKFSLSAFQQVMQMANQREKYGRLQGEEEEQKARKPNESVVRVLTLLGAIVASGETALEAKIYRLPN